MSFLVPEDAPAHPFGSSFFAQQTILELEPDRISAEFVIEVPTSIIMREFYVELQGRRPSREEDALFTRNKVKNLLSHLELTIDGKLVPWVDKTDPQEKNGVGNMNFFVYHIVAEIPWAPEVGSSYQIGLENRNYPDGGTYYNHQIWTSDAVKIKRCSLWGLERGETASDAAGEWTKNPEFRAFNAYVELLAAEGSEAAPIEEGGGRKSEARDGAPSDGAIGGGGGGYVPKVEGVPLVSYLQEADLNPYIILLALGMALFFGAAHALSPGHGKTLVAAYLVGSRGTIRHAILLGLAVTFSHTVSVILLGLITLFASQYILPETLNPILGVVSGLMIVGIGLWMLRDRWRQRKLALTARLSVEENGGGVGDEAAAGTEHAHHHGRHSHLHDAHQSHHGHVHAPDDHDHHDGHSHAPDEHDPHRAHSHDHASHHHHHGWGAHDHDHNLPGTFDMGALIRLGIAGGLVPCPTATVVLLTAIALHRIAFGLALVIAFSVGLAAVLVAIGILVVVAGSYLQRFSGSGKVLRYLPVVSAICVTILGIIITANAWMSRSGEALPLLF